MSKNIILVIIYHRHKRLNLMRQIDYRTNPVNDTHYSNLKTDTLVAELLKSESLYPSA
jgi:hypothetical protein